MERRPLAALLVLLAACSPPDPALTEPDGFLRLSVDDVVTVQFRRDHLGAAASLPISPETNSMNGAGTNLTGVLVALTPEWVVLDVKERRHWIARDSVLMVSTRRE